LDTWADEENIDILDFLCLDTEGWDPLVLMGGSRLLARVRLLEFEVHTVGTWETFKLKTLIDFLDGLCMLCFYAGQQGLSLRIRNSSVGYNSPWRTSCKCAVDFPTLQLDGPVELQLS
jgi:hypothetical protein